jgi:hypothetical protein
VNVLWTAGSNTRFQRVSLESFQAERVSINRGRQIFFGRIRSDRREGAAGWLELGSRGDAMAGKPSFSLEFGDLAIKGTI